MPEARTKPRLVVARPWQQWRANPALRLVLVIALLSGAGGLAIIQLFYSFGSLPYATELINLTGRQRMLSQEVAKFALLLQRDPGAATALNHSIEDFSQLSEGLAAAHFVSFLDELGLGSQNRETQAAVQSYLASARRISGAADRDAAVEQLLAQQKTLLPSLEALTNAVESSTARLLKKRSLQLAAGIVVVGILSVLAGYWMLSPVLRLLSQAEQENLNLLEQKRKVLEAVENCPDGILITDDSLRIEYVNPAFQTLTGYSSAELTGKTPRILQSGSHTAAFYRQMWQQLTIEGHWKGDLIDRTKHGDLVTLHSTIAVCAAATSRPDSYPFTGTSARTANSRQK